LETPFLNTGPTGANSPASAMPPAGSFIGRTVADVRVARLLGRGGMAEVYLGYHTRLGRPVAIKILYAHLRDDPMGVILYQMLAGHVPFEGSHGSVWSVLDEHLHIPPPIIPNSPQVLQQIVDRSLAKEPGSRFQRAGDLALALGGSIPHGPDGPLGMVGSERDRGDHGIAPLPEGRKICVHRVV